LQRGAPGGHTHGFFVGGDDDDAGGNGQSDTAHDHSFVGDFCAQQIVSTCEGSPTMATAHGAVGLHATAALVVFWFDTDVWFCADFGGVQPRPSAKTNALMTRIDRRMRRTYTRRAIFLA
jgi:hypothetical protein